MDSHTGFSELAEGEKKVTISIGTGFLTFRFVELLTGELKTEVWRGRVRSKAEKVAEFTSYRDSKITSGVILKSRDKEPLHLF